MFSVGLLTLDFEQNVTAQPISDLEPLISMVTAFFLLLLGHCDLLRHNPNGSHPQPLLFRFVQCGRQPALYPQHPVGHSVQPAGHDGGDQLRPSLGPFSPASSGSVLLPYAGLLPAHLSGVKTPVQPHSVPRLFPLRRDVDWAGDHPGQWELCKVRDRKLIFL